MLAASILGPFYPHIATDARTSRIGSSVPMNGLMHCSKNPSLFDHLVGTGEERGRNGKAEKFSGRTHRLVTTDVHNG
jgi:hypothetical protein